MSLLERLKKSLVSWSQSTESIPKDYLSGQTVKNCFNIPKIEKCKVLSTSGQYSLNSAPVTIYHSRRKGLCLIFSLWIRIDIGYIHLKPRYSSMYFGRLMQTDDSLEKSLMLGKVEGRRRGHQRMRWLDGITNAMDMNLGD